MAKSIIIIGAGMGGLATGCYARMNDYTSQIFEMHTLPGGQCTAWKRQGYTFDVCVHHLFGCSPESKIYSLWHELGAMPRDMVRTVDCTSILSPDGRLFWDYYDLDKLEEHMLQLAPADSRVIKEYNSALKTFTRNDVIGSILDSSRLGMLKMLPSMLRLRKWFKTTMQQYGDRFTDPFLKRAFPLLIYSSPAIPMFLHLQRHAYGINQALQWPVGGALEFSKSIEKRYKDLGGKISYRSRVEKILVENDKAVGVRLADGAEYRADIIISNADGRKTIMDMLDGKYINEQIRSYCAEPPDSSTMAVHIFLGVNRDLSREPSAMIMLLDKPVTIAGHECKSIEMQIYGFDKTLAPPGKGTIKVELDSSYSYWKALHTDKSNYEAEKKRVAEQVIEILETHFHGIKDQVEVVDVPTLMTWERFMGGTHGWFNFPNRKMSFTGSSADKNYETTLPGLDNFYFVGVWATMMGALFMNANSGKKIIRRICQKDGKKFVVKA